MKNVFSIRRFIFTLAIGASIFSIVYYAQGVTTISTNISTGGTLTVTGNATFDTDTLLVDAANNRVGIGTTTPWGLLSVNPNGITGPSFAIGSSTQTDFVVTNGGNVGIGTTSPSVPLSVSDDGTYSAYFSGRVGIGSAKASANLEVLHTTPQIHVRTSSGGGSAVLVTDSDTGPSMYAIRRQASTLWRLGITDSTNKGDFTIQDVLQDTKFIIASSTANIGIGTTTPAHRLQVSDGASATTTITIGELGLSTSRGCVNMNTPDGQSAHFYINNSGNLVSELGYCK